MPVLAPLACLGAGARDAGSDAHDHRQRNPHSLPAAAIESTSKDLVEYRPQATKIINDYQQVSAPRMNDFLKKITEYARAHPDFAPILAKYGIKPGSPTGEAPTAATSLPVVPPKP